METDMLIDRLLRSGVVTLTVLSALALAVLLWWL